MTPDQIQENNEKLLTLSDAIDSWIDAVPENVYDLCPCNCKSKMKFVLPHITEHEENFCANYIKKQE